MMSGHDNREVWQRGPIDGVTPLLQPVAHALLQAMEEAERYTLDLPAALLWQKPAGVASPGFHLLHMRGVIDRLFTYARGESLTAAQLADLTAEKEAPPSHPVAPGDLVDALRQQVDRAITQLKVTPASDLIAPRTIGRKQIPTTVIGLLFHTAEHCQRHTGQLLVTTRVLQNSKFKI